MELISFSGYATKQIDNAADGAKVAFRRLD